MTRIDEDALATIPLEVLAELKSLQEIAAQATGATPLGDPRREAGDQFDQLAKATLDTYGIAAGQLSLALGLSYDNIRLRLNRRSEASNYPSQKRYKGISMAGGRKKNVCKRGHAMVEGNLYFSSEKRRCKACAQLASKLHYEAKNAASRG